MFIEISLNDGTPIYRQIVNQVKYLIASEQLAPGSELPPIRVLAAQLQVTPNTIVKSYGELETEGLIVKRRGSGTFVSDVKSPLALRERRRILSQRIDGLLAEASQLNFSYDEIVALLNERKLVLEDAIAKEKGNDQ